MNQSCYRAIVSFGSAGVLLLAAGCGNKLPPPMDQDVAREALTAALDTWKEGQPAETLRARTPPVDFVCAMNFSYWVFHRRADLVGYFRSVRAEVCNDLPFEVGRIRRAEISDGSALLSEHAADLRRHSRDVAGAAPLECAVDLRCNRRREFVLEEIHDIDQFFAGLVDACHILELDVWDLALGIFLRARLHAARTTSNAIPDHSQHCQAQEDD